MNKQATNKPLAASQTAAAQSQQGRSKRLTQGIGAAMVQRSQQQTTRPLTRQHNRPSSPTHTWSLCASTTRLITATVTSKPSAHTCCSSNPPAARLIPFCLQSCLRKPLSDCQHRLAKQASTAISSVLQGGWGVMCQPSRQLAGTTRHSATTTCATIC